MVERDKSVLNENDFISYLDQVKTHAERVCFHVMGEPLGHKEFPSFVKLAYDNEVQLEITTNGTLLDEKNMEALLYPNVVQVNFSIQSFFDNFPRADASKYIQKILSFSKKVMLERPDLYINYRLWNQGSAKEQEELSSQKFIESLEDFFSITVNKNVDTGFKKSKKLSGRFYLHFDSRFEWPNIKSKNISLKGRCHGTLNHIAVSANGNVLPCCLDKEEEIVLGSLKEKSLTEILASKRFLDMKAGFESGRLVEKLCQRCTYIQRFD